MKNQYIADINDFRKYGLIRAISDSGNIRVGVCWMLTPDDNPTDGQFTKYLYSPEKWKQYDSVLFDLLSNIIQNGERNVSSIESTGIIQNAIYHSEFLSDIPEERSRYFEFMFERFRGVDLIFFDPDNGLEIKTRPYGRKKSSKFLYWRELTLAFNAGKSVLVYQHYIRENREQFVERLSFELCRRLNVSDVLSFLTPHVVFFLVSQPEHAQHFEKKSAVVEAQWRDQIKVHTHRQAQLDSLANSSTKIAKTHNTLSATNRMKSPYVMRWPGENYGRVIEFLFPHESGGLCFLDVGRGLNSAVPPFHILEEPITQESDKWILNNGAIIQQLLSSDREWDNWQRWLDFRASPEGASVEDASTIEALKRNGAIME